MKQGAFTIGLIFIISALGCGPLVLAILLLFGIGAVIGWLYQSSIDNEPKPTVSKQPTVSSAQVELTKIRERRENLIERWSGAIVAYFHRDLKYVKWKWLNSRTIDEIVFETCGDGVQYEGKVYFAEEGHPEYCDQPRVLKVDSNIKGTKVKRIWEGTPMKEVPLSSIEKNIQNSFKNDKGLRRILEEAFSQCLEKGEGMIDLDDIDIDFTDKRVKHEFMKSCLKIGNFKSAHLMANGHEIKVFAGDADPVM